MVTNHTGYSGEVEEQAILTSMLEWQRSRPGLDYFGQSCRPHWRGRTRYRKGHWIDSMLLQPKLVVLKCRVLCFPWLKPQKTSSNLVHNGLVDCHSIWFKLTHLFAKSENLGHYYLKGFRSDFALGVKSKVKSSYIVQSGVHFTCLFLKKGCLTIVNLWSTKWVHKYSRTFAATHWLGN